MKRGLSLSLAAAFTVACVSAASAQSVTLSLDLFYSNNNPANQGSWQLRAIGSNQGIAAVNTQVTGVVGGTAIFSAPTPAFKESFDGGTKPFTTDQDGNAATLDMLFAQIPVEAPGPQTLQYNVGVSGGLADLLGNSVDTSGVSLPSNVLLAFGRFGAGSAPVLNAARSEANVFTAQGTATNPPAAGTIVAATTSVQVRNNTSTKPGDFNLDGVVNGLDIGPLVGNFGGTGKLWQQGDANGDTIVNGLDIGPLVGSFGTDPGPADQSTVRGQYNALTGEIVISAKEVLNWVIQAADEGDIFDPSKLTLPTIPGGLNTAATNVVGVGTFAPPGQTFTDHNLGAIAPKGLGADSLFIAFESGFGVPTVRVALDVIIPEPMSVSLFGVASVLGLGFRRRRAA
jgi:hypothetical protein